MKELDTAMNTYLRHHFDSADQKEQQLFLALLQQQDPDIMVLLNAPDPDSLYYPIICKIRHTLIIDA